ncbi:MAG: wax ester/triacylglycerol synthase family O-acyltransferase [Proteobacteria bacterium]|nr:wax ester/triacylglycerol synthase family O-acyltransferase [Pseudomonadota bacterium]
MQALSGLDSSFLYLETANTPMNVGGLDVYEGSLSFEEFRDFLAKRIHLAPRLQQRLVQVPFSLDHPYWIDDPDFDIDLHLHHVALPKPGDWKQLRKLASKEFGKPLDRNRPLWEFIFVEGLDSISQVPKGSVAIISKIHHAAIDGASGAEILGLLFDVTKKPRKIPPPIEKEPMAVPGSLKLLAFSTINFIKRPLRLPGLLYETAKSTLAAGRISRVQSSDVPRTFFNAPKCILNQPISSRRLWNTALLSLKRIKALRAAVPGATLNDVLMAICTAALRRYLLEKDQLPDKPLVAMVPVSTRTTDEKNNMGNQVSAMLIQLPTDEADPIEQLRRLQANTSRGKAYQGAIGVKQMTDYAEFIPFGLGAQAARLYTRMQVSKHHRPLFNVVITNVPGPQVPLYMNGKLMLAHMGMAPIFDGMGLILPIFSYNGVLSISPTTASNIMPDVDVFARYLRESANTLEKSVQKILGEG